MIYIFRRKIFWFKSFCPTKLNSSRFFKLKSLKFFGDDFSLEEIVPYIDWSPFFWTWELKGSYPKILGHATIGTEAQKLFNDAQILLKDIIANKRFSPKAVVGIFPAFSDGDDVIIEKNAHTKTTLHF